MAEPIVFEDPAPDNRCRNGRKVWPERLNSLKAHKGKWATFPGDAARARRWAAELDGKWEVTTRPVEGTATRKMYVRYVGPK